MKRIIFCNSLSLVKKILLKEPNIKIDYFLINYNKQTTEIKKFLGNKNTYHEIKPKDFSKYNRDYLNKFINFVGNLNINNHRYLFWWALNFTNKNPITTALCNKVFYFLLIDALLKEKEMDNILVITDDINLLNQMRLWVKNKDIKIINAIKSRISLNNLKELFRQFMPLAIIFAFFRTILFKFYARRYYVISLEKEKKYIAVMSLINHQSFTKEGDYRDAYFGEFPEHLNKNNLPFIILSEILFPPYRSVLKRAVFNIRRFPIVPKEYFLSFLDLLRCLSISLKKYLAPVKLKGKIEINGIDLSYLVKQSIREDYNSTKFFSNLCFYYSTKSLTRYLKIEKFFYPFENRSFEKMVLLALRKYSPNTKILGYQHASISQRHANFFLGKDEINVTPFPDVIITMGEITKKILQEEGRFPESILRQGCALRSNSFEDRFKKRNSKLTHILVTLATNLEEYVKTLIFLDEAFKNTNSYNIYIRPHPVFSLEEAIKMSPVLRFNFSSAKDIPLNEAFQWADLVIYVHSTLSLEAIREGIPVVNIQMGEPLNPDPLFDFKYLKWSVNSPDKLIDTIREIENIPEEEFINRQINAKEYAKEYIRPVTESNLRAFLDV